MSDKVKNVVITIMFVSVLVVTMIVNIAKTPLNRALKFENPPKFV